MTATLTPPDWPEGFTFDPEDSRHGSINGYGNLKCRCPECREENTARRAERREAVRNTLDDDDERHGTNNAYTNYGCKCDPCKEAHAIANYRGTS